MLAIRTGFACRQAVGVTPESVESVYGIVEFAADEPLLRRVGRIEPSSSETGSLAGNELTGQVFFVAALKVDHLLVAYLDDASRQRGYELTVVADED